MARDSTEARSVQLSGVCLDPETLGNPNDYQVTRAACLDRLHSDQRGPRMESWNTGDKPAVDPATLQRQVTEHETCRARPNGLRRP